MQRVYGEFNISATTNEDIVQLIKEYETNLGLNEVPSNLALIKLGVKVNGACEILVNGRTFSINEKEPLEFAYNSIKVTNLAFKTTGIQAVVRYAYLREDKVYQ